MSHVRFIWHLWSSYPLFCLHITAFFVSSHLSFLLRHIYFFIPFSFDFSIFLLFLITFSLSSLYVISSFTTSYPSYVFRCLHVRALNLYLSHFLFIYHFLPYFLSTPIYFLVSFCSLQWHFDYFLFNCSLLSSTFYYSSIFLYLHITTLNRLMSHVRFI